jgi:nucleoside-diphosphate-sugar epimerase
LIAALKPLASLKLVVCASSILVCGIGYRPQTETADRPSTAYCESKVAGEILVREQAEGAFPWLIVRPTSIWGP